MSRVLVAGHVNWDVTVRVDRLPQPDDESLVRSRRCSGGGSAANAAVAFERLRIKTSILASVGDDEHGRAAREELEAAGVDCTPLVTIANAETTTKYVLVDDEGEVAVLGNDGVNEAIGPDDIDDSTIQGVDHVHLTSQRPATAVKLAELAADAGLSISVDPGRRVADRPYDGAIAVADVLLLNDREANSLLGNAPKREGLTTVVKRGEQGAVAYVDDRTIEVPGLGVDVVDTTGAGDAFAAGFLARWIENGNVEKAITFANACGALAATENGARTAPSRSDVDALLAEEDPD